MVSWATDETLYKDEVGEEEETKDLTNKVITAN